jgi:hypothetical protein
LQSTKEDRMKLILVGVVGLALLCVVAQASEWVSRYDGGYGADEAASLALS